MVIASVTVTVIVVVAMIRFTVTCICRCMGSCIGICIRIGVCVGIGIGVGIGVCISLGVCFVSASGIVIASVSCVLVVGRAGLLLSLVLFRVRVLVLSLIVRWPLMVWMLSLALLLW